MKTPVREILRETLRLTKIASPVVKELETIESRDLEQRCFTLTTFRFPVNNYNSATIKELLSIPRDAFTTYYAELKRSGISPENIKTNPQLLLDAYYGVKN